MKRPTATERIRALELEVARLKGIIETLRAVQPPAQAPVVIPFFYPGLSPQPSAPWQSPTITWCARPDGMLTTNPVDSAGSWQ